MYFENLTNITKFPNYSGFLTKKSSSIFNIFGNKVKRFFILSQNKIFYKHNMESDYIIKNFYLNSNTIIRTSDDNDNAFEIIFNNNSQPNLYLECVNKTERISWCIVLECSLKIIKYIESFEQIKKIGTGAFGNVYKIKHKISNEIVVLKQVQIYDQLHQKQIQTEIEILNFLTTNNVNHVIMFKNIIIGSKQIYMYFPYEEQSDLFDYLTQNNFKLNSNQIKKIVKQIATGLDAIHSNNIIHLDIKIENILINSNLDIKIIDFGLSKFVEIEPEIPSIDELLAKSYEFLFKEVELNYIGTLSNIAPEILLLNCYSKFADIWSFGIIVYILNFTSHPFYNKSKKNIINNILNCNVNNTNNNSDSIDFVSELINFDPQKRITAKRILNHKYLTNIT